MAERVRSFPLPWTIEGNDACFWVEDAEGKRVAFIYFDEPFPRAIGADYFLKLNRAEALRIARNIVKLPELLKRLSERGPDRLRATEDHEPVEQDR